MKFQILILIVITNIKADDADNSNPSPPSGSACYKDFLRSFNLLANDFGSNETLLMCTNVE